MPPDSPVVFDQAALRKRVTETVTASFGMMIPEDQWQSLVEREIKAYFEEPTDMVFVEGEAPTMHWGNAVGQARRDAFKARMTPFRLLVWTAVTDHCHAHLQGLLGGEKFRAMMNTVYGNGDQTVEVQMSEWMGKKLEQLAPKMAMHFFAQALVMATDEAKNRIRSELAGRR